MSKFLCSCGETIRDQSDNLSYKAYYITDKTYEDYQDSIDNDINNFINSINKNQKENWIKDHFGEKYYKLNLNNASIISDIISGHKIKYESNIYQCEKCSRIYIQEKKSNKLHEFIPQSCESKNIFDH